MATGAVAGLVGVTSAASFVTPTSGMIIGLIKSVICYCSINIKNHFDFDDSLDTFAFHGVGGTICALLTGVFANAELISSHPASQILSYQERSALIFGQFETVLVAYCISAIITI